jgi:transposase-like protein
MVRLFTAFGKTLLKKLCDTAAFCKDTGEYSCHGKSCPNCGAVGKLTDHGKYTRGLTHGKRGKLVDSILNPRRVKCSSCGATHALLPDIVIPYGRYSLSFVLAALIAYFERATTVEKTCQQLGIAISTIYEWKKRMVTHKDLMLGLLISRKVPALAFLRGLLKSKRLSDTLSRFFHRYGFSFMQRRSTSAARSRPP